MADKFNVNEMRELKLGSTFTNPRKSAFHTLKYDFKPASVDVNKMASVDIGENNHVTVTVPHLDESVTQQTEFKGSHKNYTKECVLIVNKLTGEVTIEKLTNNIQVKKTRHDNGSKVFYMQDTAPKQEKNATQRQSTKTRVASGGKKNAIAGYQPSQSLVQGPGTYSVASQWSAAHNQSSSASLPMIGMDEAAPSEEIRNSATTVDEYPSFSAAQRSKSPKPKVTNWASKHAFAASTSKLSPIQGSSVDLIAANDKPYLASLSLMDINDLAPAEVDEVQMLPETVPTLASSAAVIKTQDSSDMIGVLSSSSSSSDSDSDSSNSDFDHAKLLSPKNGNRDSNGAGINPDLSSSLAKNLLKEDLCLSESSSDSDSD